MKNTLFLLLIISLFFSSCEDELKTNLINNLTNNLSSEILGTWEIENYTDIQEFGVVENITNLETITSTDIDIGPEDGERWFVTINDTSMIFLYYDYNIMNWVDVREYTKDGNIYYFQDVLGGFLTITHLTDSNLFYNHMYLENYDDWSSNGIPDIIFDRQTFIGNMKKSELP
tara:strand:+ start:584 stop:1102 length:519 start_codon:yes stop_codon:yes gene_type:complete